eukprot:gene14942-biopygen6236
MGEWVEDIPEYNVAGGDPWGHRKLLRRRHDWRALQVDDNGISWQAIDVQHNKELCVIPQGGGGQFAFHALCQRRQISALLAIALWRTPVGRILAAKGVMVIGDPEGGGKLRATPFQVFLEGLEQEPVYLGVCLCPCRGWLGRLRITDGRSIWELLEDRSLLRLQSGDSERKAEQPPNAGSRDRPRPAPGPRTDRQPHAGRSRGPPAPSLQIAVKGRPWGLRWNSFCMRWCVDLRLIRKRSAPMRGPIVILGRESIINGRGSRRWNLGTRGEGNTRRVRAQDGRWLYASKVGWTGVRSPKLSTNMIVDDRRGSCSLGEVSCLHVVTPCARGRRKFGIPFGALPR